MNENLFPEGIQRKPIESGKEETAAPRSKVDEYAGVDGDQKNMIIALCESLKKISINEFKLFLSIVKFMFNEKGEFVESAAIDISKILTKELERRTASKNGKTAAPVA